MGYCSTDKNGMLHAKIHGSSSSGSGLKAQGDRTVDPLFFGWWLLHHRLNDLEYINVKFNHVIADQQKYV